MPRIPRTEANVQVAYAEQPRMSPDALTGPGRALQRLGGAIGSFGAAIDGAVEQANQPTDDERFQADLALVKFGNDQDFAERERQATYTGEPDGYTDGSVGDFDTKREELLGSLPQKPEIQRRAMLATERMRGARQERAYGYESTKRHGKLLATIEETAGQTVTMAEPGSVDDVTAKIKGVDAMIERAPISESEKAALRDKMSSQALTRILEGVPDEDKLDKADEITKRWMQELNPIAPGQAPQQGQPGSPSGPAADPTGFKPDLRSDLGGPVEFAQPPLQRTVGRPRDPAQIKGVVMHQTWGSDTMAGNGSWSNKKGTGANYYIDKEGKIYQWAPDDVSMGHIGKGRNSANNKRPDFTNDNTIGVEIMTRPNERPNEKQIAAAQRLTASLSQKYGFDPGKDVFGHGELTDPRHRRSDEAIEVVNAIRGGGNTRMALGAPGSAADTGKEIVPKLTAYSPQKGGDKMEGGYAAARPGPDGKAEVRTLEDLRAGKSNYITLAGPKEMEGKSYTIPKISWVGKDGQTYTQENVRGVVHDTGAAFKGKPEGRFDIPIDRDATDKQMAASNGLWKDVRLIPEGGDTPVAQRGLTQYAGLTNPEPPKGVQVADASGAVPQSATTGRAENTIPGSTQPQPIQPVGKPSVRGAIIDGLLKMRPALVEAKQRALGAKIDEVKKLSQSGDFLPDDQRAVLREKVTASGDTKMLEALDAAEAAAQYTRTLKQRTIEQVKGEAARLREELTQGGGTLEFRSRVEAVEGLAASMEKGLSDDSIGWATKNAGFPPPDPITPDNFTVDALLARKAVADQIGEKYGMQYRQFFRNGEEKAAIEAAFTKGGDEMVDMLSTMYEAFGDDTPKAVAEITPKNPEAAHAAYLISTGGDPKAVKDVADTIMRRKEEGYPGAPKIENDKLMASFRTMAGSLSGATTRTPGSLENMGITSKPKFESGPVDRRVSDKILATAKAIYEARVQDPSTYDEDLMEESIGLALGQRSNSAGETFGGALSQRDGDWENPYAGGNTVLIPSTIKKNMFNVVLDAIDEKVLTQAGAPLPAGRDGKPMPVFRAINNTRLDQVAPGKYMLWQPSIDPSGRDVGGYLMTATPPLQTPGEVSTTDIVAGAQQGSGDYFVLDLEKLTPILRDKLPSAFWKE